MPPQLAHVILEKQELPKPIELPKPVEKEKPIEKPKPVVSAQRGEVAFLHRPRVKVGEAIDTDNVRAAVQATSSNGLPSARDLGTIPARFKR